MKLHHFILFVLLGFSWNLHAQDGLIFNHFGRENGFPLDKADCIVQDAKGFIWVGTKNGLCRYDGYTCKNFLPQHRDSTTISNREIRCLIVDAQGDIWAGTANGLNYINAKTNQIRVYDFSSKITSVLEDANYNIWVGTQDAGLHKLDRKTGKTTTCLVEETVNAIHEDRFENLWAGTNDGLYLIDRDGDDHKKYSHKTYGNSLSNSTIMQIASSSNGYLWIATWGGGLNRAELDRNGMLRNFTVYNQTRDNGSICSNILYRLAIDKSNNLWIGSWDSGLSLLPTNQQSLAVKDAVFQNYNSRTSSGKTVSGDNISALYVDRENNIWVGADKVDRVQIVSNTIDRYELPDLKDGKASQVASFAKHKNKLWVGANQYVFEYDLVNGKYVFSKEHYPTKRIPPLGAQQYYDINAMYASEEGLWIGTDGAGLFFYPYRNGELYLWGARLYNKETNERIPGVRISAIKPSRVEENVIWVGTEDGGLFKANTNSRGIVDVKKYKLEHAVRALLEDKKGDMWIGTSEGLNVLARGVEEMQSYYWSTDTLSLNDNVINSILEDSSHHVWISTNSGLNKSVQRGGKILFERFPKTACIGNETLFGILEDAQKNLWIQMYNGVLKFNPESGLLIDRFGGADFENAHLKQNSCLKVNEHLFAVGNVGSFVCYNPDEMVANKDSFKLAITDIQIFDKTIFDKHENHDAEKLQLSCNDDKISFHFSNMSFQAPSEVSYYYKLDGFDRKWNKLTGANVATYTNLAAGDYAFHVSSLDSIQNENTCTVFFQVTPPWWQRFPAILLHLVIIAAICWLIVSVLRRKSNKAQDLPLAAVDSNQEKEEKGDVKPIVPIVSEEKVESQKNASEQVEKQAVAPVAEKKKPRRKKKIDKDIHIPTDEEVFLKHAVEAIHRNLNNEKFDVEAFSVEMNLSQNQLYRKLKAITGETAKEFIRNQRLQVAADMLGQGKTASDVIKLTGFASLSYFSRCFKDAYGCAPTEYVKES